jgi:hypothetical protein
LIPKSGDLGPLALGQAFHKRKRQSFGCMRHAGNLRERFTVSRVFEKRPVKRTLCGDPGERALQNEHTAQSPTFERIKRGPLGGKPELLGSRSNSDR